MISSYTQIRQLLAYLKPSAHFAFLSADTSAFALVVILPEDVAAGEDTQIAFAKLSRHDFPGKGMLLHQGAAVIVHTPGLADEHITLDLLLDPTHFEDRHVMTLLAQPDCTRLSLVLHRDRHPQDKPVLLRVSWPEGLRAVYAMVLEQTAALVDQPRPLPWNDLVAHFYESRQYQQLRIEGDRMVEVG